MVSKICSELENHLGINDKDLAEFIIFLAEKNDTYEKFKSVLIENGAEFTDSFIANLLRLIQRMNPKSKDKMTLNEEEVKDVFEKSSLSLFSFTK